MQKKTTANYRHTENLNYFYFNGRGLTTHTHTQTQNKRNKKGTSLPCRPGRPARSGLIVAKWRTLRLVRSVSGPRADRLRTCSPLFVVDGSREGFTDSRAENERPTKKGSRSNKPPILRRKKTTRARQTPSQRERKKERDRNQK